MPTVSICLCTIDRYDLTVQCVGHAINSARQDGIDIELLSADNGSQDTRVIEYIRSLNPTYHRVNGFNAGYAPMLNQMILRSTGEYICILDNDILLPDHWLSRLIAANKDIPNSGFSSYHCVQTLQAEQTLCGHRVHLQEKPFGIKFFNRLVLDALGSFCQDYGLYGLEDIDAFLRATYAGFLNYYVHDPVGAKHLGEDSGEKTPYRQMKWKLLDEAWPKLDPNLARYRDTKNYYIPMPELS
jgi:glycosyltransferase involved in cell wall biosynthesis